MKFTLFVLMAAVGWWTCARSERIALMTIAKGERYATMTLLAHRNHEHFAALNGFEYISPDDEDGVLPGAWWKIKALLTHLPHYDWIMWMDADTVVCNWDLDARNYTRTPADLVLSADILGSKFNTGVFWIRNCDWSLDFLGRTLAIGYGDPGVRHHGWYEQLAMQRLYDANPDDASHFYIIPNERRHEFNGYVLDDSFRRSGMGIIHDAGCRFRMDAHTCQRYYRAYYCMCLPPGKKDDENCQLGRLKK